MTAKLFGLSFLVVLATPLQGAELVKNGGFESGDFSGWTLNDPSNFTDVYLFDAHSGTYYARLSAIGPTSATLTQSFSTVTGETYSISFWLANETGPIGQTLLNSFTASFDNNPPQVQFVNHASFDYTEFTFSAVASSASSILKFEFLNPPATWRLDDVSVVGQSSAIPEPAAWTLMIGGFGLVGAALRQRRVNVSFG